MGNILPDRVETKFSAELIDRTITKETTIQLEGFTTMDGPKLSYENNFKRI